MQLASILTAAIVVVPSMLAVIPLRKTPMSITANLARLPFKALQIYEIY